MNRAIVVLSQIDGVEVRNGAWIIDNYTDKAIIEGTIEKRKMYYLTFRRLYTSVPSDVFDYATTHGISLEPTATILTCAHERLFCYRLD